ncbi:S-layer protein [Streptococcus iniae]|uniref:transglutaminase domain-containing protein n=1 Tax=Streptococcus iniae TaxID=1346 RepID=UPI0008D96D57|nr:transglutaminase domain-containing protein [Streptococcus iniae]OHX27704.1 S-layer protein [Streptococcus iniae]RLV27002.1 S-layer protein [Streptococcus iniae]
MKRKFPIIILLTTGLFLLTACFSNAPKKLSDNHLVLQSKERKNLLNTIKNRYYFNQLSDEQKENYLILRQKASTFKDTISLTPASQKSVIKTIDAFIMDNPDLYWLSSNPYQIELSQNDAFVTFKVPDDAEQNYQKIQEITDHIIAQAPMTSDYDKVSYFYKTIIENTDYNKEALDRFNAGDQRLAAQNQDVRSVFLEHKSVCNGYAQAFQLLCQKAGISSIYVKGTVKSSQTEKELPHAWNLVAIADHYYAVDTTWGDPIFDQMLSGQRQENINYNFLCMPDHVVNRSHHANLDLDYQKGKKIKNAWTLPDCTDDSLLYSKQNQFYLEHFNTDEVLNTLENQLLNGQNPVSIQMANEQDFLSFTKDIESNNTKYHELFNHYWSNYSGYSYSIIPELYSISFHRNE